MDKNLYTLFLLLPRVYPVLLARAETGIEAATIGRRGWPCERKCVQRISVCPKERFLSSSSFEQKLLHAPSKWTRFIMDATAGVFRTHHALSAPRVFLCAGCRTDLSSQTRVKVQALVSRLPTWPTAQSRRNHNLMSLVGNSKSRTACPRRRNIKFDRYCKDQRSASKRYGDSGTGRENT